MLQNAARASQGQEKGVQSIPYASRILHTILLNPHMGASGLPCTKSFTCKISNIKVTLTCCTVIAFVSHLHVDKHFVVADVLLYLL